MDCIFVSLLSRATLLASRMSACHSHFVCSCKNINWCSIQPNGRWDSHTLGYPDHYFGQLHPSNQSLRSDAEDDENSLCSHAWTPEVAPPTRSHLLLQTRTVDHFEILSPLRVIWGLLKTRTLFVKDIYFLGHDSLGGGGKSPLSQDSVWNPEHTTQLLQVTLWILK